VLTINTSTKVQQPGTKEASLSDSRPLEAQHALAGTDAKKAAAISVPKKG